MMKKLFTILIFLFCANVVYGETNIGFDKDLFSQKIISYYSQFNVFHLEYEEICDNNKSNTSLDRMGDTARQVRRPDSTKLFVFETLFQCDKYCLTNIYKEDSKYQDEDTTSITGTLKLSKNEYHIRLGSHVGSSIYGYVCSLWIPDIIRRPDIIVDYDINTKIVTYSGDFVIDGDHYSIKLNFDPLNDGLLLSADVDAIYTPERLGDWFSKEGVVPKDYPELHEVTHLEHLQSYQLSNGFWVPKKVYHNLTPAPMFVLSNERNAKDLKPKISRDVNGTPILTKVNKRITRINLLNIDFSPAFKKSKKLSWVENPPNGTSIYIMEAPQIEYIWMDGEIVPKTDERMLAIAQHGHKFIPGKDEPRFWLMAIGLLLILVAGGIQVRRYLKSR